MTRKKKNVFSRFFNSFSNAVTKATGKPIAFIVATLPILHTWQKKKKTYLQLIQLMKQKGKVQLKMLKKIQ